MSRFHTRPAHHFTVDVEEYFQVPSLEALVPRWDWDRYPSRVEASVSKLLDLLSGAHVRGTFFVLGWIAVRHPDLVRKIAQRGHEIASQGWDGRHVTEQSPTEFRESVRRSKQLLEELTGGPVVGFRAPGFSIVRGREWAFDVLIGEGYQYDSSYRAFASDPHVVPRQSGRLHLFPPAALTWWRWKVPAGGGEAFRLLPYALVRAALRACEHRRTSGTFYIHAWETDPGQPRLDLPWPLRLRQYAGLRWVQGRLRRLLREFRFQTIAESLAQA